MTSTNGLRPTARHAPALPRLGVVVVDPAPTGRAGIALLISGEPDMEVLGEAGSADEGLQCVRRVRRRSRVIVLVSLGLPGEHDSFWLIRQIRERCPHYVIVGFGIT